MKDGLRPEERERLAELLWLAPDDPLRVRALADAPHLARELADLEAAAARVHDAARVSAARAAQRDASPSAATRALEDAALAALGREVAGPSVPRVVNDEPGTDTFAPPQRPRAFWFIGVVAAAAALALVVRLVGGDHEAQVWLSPAVEGARGTPHGEVAAWSVFEWSPAPLPGSVHVVQVWSARDAAGPPDVESAPCTTPSWTPSSADVLSIGSTFAWSVVERNPIDGTTRTLFEARVVSAP